MKNFIIIFFVVVVLIFVVVFRIKIKENELEDEKEKLTEEYNSLQYENEKIKDKLDKELDDETIINTAQDELGLVESGSEYYFFE